MSKSISAAPTKTSEAANAAPVLLQAPQSSIAPTDEGGLAYAVVFFQGVGSLLPWNVFILAFGYFSERFCSAAYSDTFENYFSITFCAAQMLALAVTLMFRDHITVNKKIAIPLVCCVALSGVAALLTALRGTNMVFVVTLVSIWVCGSASGVLSDGLLSLTNMFPPQYTNALLNGQSFSGLLVSLCALLTQLASPAWDDCTDDGYDDGSSCSYRMNYAALVYFIIVSCLLLASMAAFVALKRLTVTRYHMARSAGTEGEALNVLVATPIDEGATESAQGHASEVATKAAHATAAHDGSVAQNAESAVPTVTFELSSVRQCFMTIQLPALTLLATTVVTTALFPSVTALLESTRKCENNERFFGDLFVPCLFFIFCVCDFGGRLLSGVVPPPSVASERLWVGAAARVLLIPALLLCNLKDSQLYVLFNSDGWPIAFVILMGLSNGYICSRCVALASSVVGTGEFGLVAITLLWCVAGGMLVGACLSFVLVPIALGSM